jgi:RimJ/RimL family protein N-acetyltransferase
VDTIPLTTKRLTLRAFTLEDAPAVQSLAGNPAVAATTLNIPHPYADGMAEEWIASHVPNWETKQCLTLAITSKAHGLVGAISLKLDMTHRRADMGYWIGVPFWNQGFATEAAAAVLEYGFTELGLHRIYAHHFASNPASGRVMQKLGMKKEGVLRQHIIKGISLEDVVVYAVLSTKQASE